MPGDLKTLNSLMPLRFILLLLFSGALISCREGSVNNSPRFRPGKEVMADMNRYIIQKDRERIQSYCDRKGLSMKESPTGLWYIVVKEGRGNLFQENDRIIFDYECRLLDGTECYSSKESGPKDIVLGRSELPAGLNEGLKLLRSGGEAIFILPPFLAYGLIGDGKKIPPRATVVYNVSVVLE